MVFISFLPTILFCYTLGDENGYEYYATKYDRVMKWFTGYSQWRCDRGIAPVFKYRKTSNRTLEQIESAVQGKEFYKDVDSYFTERCKVSIKEKQKEKQNKINQEKLEQGQQQFREQQVQLDIVQQQVDTAKNVTERALLKQKEQADQSFEGSSHLGYDDCYEELSGLTDDNLTKENCETLENANCFGANVGADKFKLFCDEILQSEEVTQAKKVELETLEELKQQKLKTNEKLKKLKEVFLKTEFKPLKVDNKVIYMYYKDNEIKIRRAQVVSVDERGNVTKIIKQDLDSKKYKRTVKLDPGNRVQFLQGEQDTYVIYKLGDTGTEITLTGKELLEYFSGFEDYSEDYKFLGSAGGNPAYVNSEKKAYSPRFVGLYDLLTGGVVTQVRTSGNTVYVVGTKDWEDKLTQDEDPINSFLLQQLININNQINREQKLKTDLPNKQVTITVS